MEAFLLVILIIAFVWLAMRQGELGRRIRELEEELRSLATKTSTPAVVQTAPQPQTYVMPVVPPASAPPGNMPVAAQHVEPPAVVPYRAALIPPPPAPPPAPPVPRTAPATPVMPVSFAQPLAREAAPSLSLEARLGQNWLSKLGITALVIGLAMGLGTVVRHMGPLGKSLLGLLLAVAVLSVGIFLERKPNYRLFARACIGGGWALLFFLSFAIYHVPLLHCLDSQLADLVLMLVVAAGMVTHSLRYHSQTVTTIAFVLAFVTVGLSEVTLFSLVAGALLVAALNYVVARERWYALGLAGLVGVYLNHFLWLQRVLPHGGTPGHTFPEFLPSALLLLCYWLTFRLVYVLRPPLEGADHDLGQTLATLTALLNSVGLLSLLKYQSSHPEWAFYGLLALGLVELALSVLARGSMHIGDEVRPRNRVAFITLSSIAAVLLLAAIPFHFHDASWPMLWLLEAEAFYLVGLRLPEVVFRRLGMLSSLLTGLLLVPGPLLYSVHHPYISDSHATLTLFTAAFVLWLNAEFFTRRWPAFTQHTFDAALMRVSSFLAALLAALGLTMLLRVDPVMSHPTAAVWLGVAWLLLSLAIGFVADWLASTDLATQADLLAVAGVVHTLSVNLFLNTETVHGISLRLLTVGAAAALLYGAMRRRTAPHILPAAMIGNVYSWLAGLLVALLCWYQLQPISVAVAWGVFGLVLFELGIVLKKNYLRQQAYVLLAAAFVRLFFANLQVPGAHGEMSPSLYTVLPLIAALAYLYERTRGGETATGLTKMDRLAGSVFSWCAMVGAGTLLYFELRPEWVVLAWTALALVLLGVACARTKKSFLAQSLVVVLAVGLRAIFFHLFSPAPLAATFVTSRVFVVALVAALLWVALPGAFYLRRRFESGDDSLLHVVLGHPEQPYFFVPLLSIALLIDVQFHGGGITIGWVVLGLCAFLFALAVKERSYRLSGLGLLLLGVAKVLAWDVWHVAPTERYLTLIVMGAALLLVSFLYSRYRETLLKLL